MSRSQIFGGVVLGLVAASVIWLSAGGDPGAKPSSSEPETLMDRLAALKAQPTVRPSSERGSDAPSLNRHLVKEEARAERAQWVRRMHEDDRGAIPDNAVMEALKSYQGMTPKSLQPRRAGITSTGWTEMGPSRIGGRVRAIAVHADNPSHVWLGGVAGGLWKSTNEGDHWEPVTTFNTNLAITSIVIKPSDSSVMWAGTGESFTGGVLVGVGVRGAGVFRSNDGGATWTQLANTSSWHYVNRLAVSPDGTSLLAAVSFEEGSPLSSAIYRSINDGGLWSPTLPGDFGDVDFHPTDSSRAVAGLTQSGASAPIFYSDMGGQFWTAADLEITRTVGAVTDQSLRIELAWSRDGTLYASEAVSRVGSALPGTGGIYRSTDNGATWSIRNRSDIAAGGQVGNGAFTLAGQGHYGNALWVHPTDSNLVLAGGRNMFRSTDGGTNFARITDSNSTPEWGKSKRSVHADHHILVAHPNFPLRSSQIYMGNDGGVYTCVDPYTAGQDGDPNWSPGFTRMNNNLRIAQFYVGDIIGSPGQELFAGGTQDNGTLAYVADELFGIDMDLEWYHIRPGDGGITAWDPSDINYLYSCSQYGHFTRRDGGVPFHPQLSEANVEEYDLDGLGGTIRNSRILDTVAAAPFIPTAMDLDPEDPETLWIGLQSLWRTRDARTDIHKALPTEGPTWQNVLLSDEAVVGFISVVKVDPNQPATVWVGFDGGMLMKSVDGRADSPTFSQIGPTVNTAGGGSQEWPIRCLSGIAIDPQNGDHVCVSFGGFSVGNVWVTEDGGLTWTELSGMPAFPAFDVEIHPFQSNSLYVATEVGVIASSDHGATWTATAEGHDGPVATRVTDLLWLEDTLYAATFGRGLFRHLVSQPASLYMRPGLSDRIPWPPRGILEPIEISSPVLVATPGDDLRAGTLDLRSGRTWVWSSDPSDDAEPDVQMHSSVKLELRSKRSEASPLGRVYLLLTEKRVANTGSTGTSIWGLASALVPKDAKVTTLLGLAVRATKDEMAAALNVSEFLSKVIQRSAGELPPLAPGGYAFADAGVGD